MKFYNRSELYRKNTRELAGMQEEIRKEIGACEQQRRKNYAALADVKRVQAQRRIMRPDL